MRDVIVCDLFLVFVLDYILPKEAISPTEIMIVILNYNFFSVSMDHHLFLHLKFLSVFPLRAFKKEYEYLCF